MMTAGQLAETFERIRLGEHTPEDLVGLEDHIATLTAELEQAKARNDGLMEKSVLAMSYAEDEVELWEHVEPTCPMLDAVRQLRRRADSEYSLRVKTEAELRESRSREDSLLTSWAELKAIRDSQSLQLAEARKALEEVDNFGADVSAFVPPQYLERISRHWDPAGWANVRKNLTSEHAGKLA